MYRALSALLSASFVARRVKSLASILCSLGRPSKTKLLVLSVERLRAVASGSNGSSGCKRLGRLQAARAVASGSSGCAPRVFLAATVSISPTTRHYNFESDQPREPLHRALQYRPVLLREAAIAQDTSAESGFVAVRASVRAGNKRQHHKRERLSKYDLPSALTLASIQVARHLVQLGVCAGWRMCWLASVLAGECAGWRRAISSISHYDRDIAASLRQIV